MKVLHVFGAMDVGGAELRTLELARHFASQGIESHFLTLSGREGSLAADIRAMGGQVHPIALDAGFPVRYIRLLRSLRPDVIDSHVATFSGALVLGAWACRVPRRIAHFRSDGDGHCDSLRRRLQRSVLKELIRGCATDIVGVSPSALTDGYRSDWPEDPRARVVVNGLPAFSADSNAPTLQEIVGAAGSSVMLHVGRPSKEKNRIQTVRVLKALRDRGVDIQLALAGGQGPDTVGILEEAARLGVHEFVHDLGTRLDARQLMSTADVLLLTSVREGLPGVVLEALSTGTPVVATELSGVRFIAAQLPGVYAVPLRDSIERWAATVSDALQDSKDVEWRRALVAEFEASPFAYPRALEEQLMLYSGIRL